MLCVHIPGRGDLNLSHLVLDYNGTIALDGDLISGVAPRLEALAQDLDILVMTADNHGTAAKACNGLPVRVLTFPVEAVGEIKAREVLTLQGGVACVGNGFNDVAMAEACDLSVCVMGSEGCCGALMAKCDVVVTSVTDALDLLLKPQRLRATLRA